MSAIDISSSQRWWRSSGVTGLSILWVIFVAGCYVLAAHNEDYGFSVYRVYHQSAQAVLHHEPLYDGTSGWVYLYPPLLAQSIAPLAAVADYDAAALIWFGGNVLLLVGVVSLLARYVPIEWKRRFWLLPILFLPVGQALFIGQVTIIMLALLAGAWIAVTEDKPFIAGCLLALAAWLKVYPALLVIYFLWRRDWRIIMGVAVAGIMLGLGQFVISGHALMDYFDILSRLASDGQPESTYESLSLFAFVSRLFQHNLRVYPLLENATLFSLSRALLTLSIIGITAYALMRALIRPASRNYKLNSADTAFDLEYGMVMMAALMIGSTLWVSGLPPMLLLAVLVLRNQERLRIPGRARVLCGLSFTLVSIHLLLILAAGTAALHALIFSIGFFGVLLAWGLMAALLIEQRLASSELQTSHSMA